MPDTTTFTDAEQLPVRLAELSDEEQLMAMAPQVHAETCLLLGNNNPMPYCAEKARATILRAILPQRNYDDAGQAWIGIVGTPGGPIEGSTYLSIESSWSSQAPFLLQLWNYVLPEFRGRSQNAKLLISFSTAMARTLAMPLVSAAQKPANQRFYERTLGCQPFGAMYLYHPAVSAEAL